MIRLHLVDGTFELFRAHFSPRPGHSDVSGRDVKATVGLASSLLQLLDDPEEAVSHIAVAFDNPVESFRNDLFDGYKTGEGMPEEDGFTEIWKDGRPIASDRGPNAYNDRRGPYLRIGPYKWPWKKSAREAPSVVTSRTIYFDEVRIGTAIACLEVVSPP